jgi:Domain of unknown function (DUF4177)
MAELPRWEYRFETVGSILTRPKDEEIEEIFNQWGEEGWEIVHFGQESSKLLILARRPLTLTTRRERSMPGY